MTLKVAPFFKLLLIFYLFGVATVLMFLLFGLFYLSIVSGLIWAIIVLLSIRSTGKRFYEQSIKRYWGKKQ